MQPIANFSGVSGSKLMMGILASTRAGGSNYYFAPKIISQFKKWIEDNNYELKGFMIWDSNWDKLNKFEASNACTS